MEKFEDKKFTVAISTLIGNYNFGNRLQNYALQEFISSNFSANVLTLENNPYLLNKRGRLATLAYKLMDCKNLLKIRENKRSKFFDEFNERFITFDKTKYDYNNFKDLNKKYDYFVVGSDQVWNNDMSPNLLTYLLPFVDNNKKIAYSASNAKNELSGVEKGVFKEYLNDFKAISVREDKTVDLISEYTSKKVEMVLDPTLLLDKTCWQKIERAPKSTPKKEYVLVYILGKLTKEQNKRIKDFAKLNNLEIVNILDKNGKYYELGPSEFVWLVSNAKIVLSDSFHCSAFSVIFSKPFVHVKREDRFGDMTSRLKSLETKLNLHFLSLNDLDRDNVFDADYSHCQKILLLEREKSLNFLQTAFSPIKQENNLKDYHVNCSGCGLCANICPTKAISYKKNDKGFISPVIDESKCVHCGKCKLNCTYLSEYQKENFDNKIIYAVKNKGQNVKYCSSTGVVGRFCEQIIKNKGVVYGVQYSSLSNEYVRCEKLADLKEIRGSKYYQADATKAYDKIEKDLERGKKVLFVGTPCQVAGLRKKFGENENLFLVAVVCHGVPSYDFFKKYCIEKYGEIPKFVAFRKHISGWENYGLEYKLQKETKLVDKETDLYMRLFLNNLSLNDCCYNCNYAGKNYGADLIAGDFWNIKKVDKKFYSNDGVSILVVNSKVGDKLLSEVYSGFEIKQIDKEKYGLCNANLFGPLQIFNNYKNSLKFYEEQKILGIEATYEQMLTSAPATFKDKVKNKIKRLLKI